MEDQRPNIILITCDQLRFDYIGATSGGKIHTRNIDRLAAEGCLYENAYSPNPVCIPARHNLITGLTARHHGFDDNYFGAEAKPCPYYLPTFAQILRDGGYETIAIGKMHFQPERNATGFDFFYNMNEVVPSREADDYAVYLKEKGFGNVQYLHGVRNCLYMQPQRSLIPAEHHGSAWVADKTIQYLQQTRGRQPFLLWAGFIHPHPPLDVPDDWANLYDDQIPSPIETQTPLSTLAEENKKLACLHTPELVKRMRELYASAITFTDFQIGRILQTLDELNLAKNTLVVFTSDHGEMLGDLGTYQKFLPYDASSKIPLILRWPSKIKAGSKYSQFADLNDLLPTFLDVARLAYPANYDLPGASLLTEDGGKDRFVQYVEHQHGSKRWCSLRDAHYKYVYYYGDDEQLFDMQNDPQETTNLLFGEVPKEARAIADALRDRLTEYEGRFGLAGYVKDGALIRLPRYEAHPYYETCIQPFALNLPEAEANLMNQTDDEILAAIRNEPLVRLRSNDNAEILRAIGFSEERIEALFRRAEEQRREQDIQSGSSSFPYTN
jgi:arylsulfatase A-like enzyme